MWMSILCSAFTSSTTADAHQNNGQRGRAKQRLCQSSEEAARWQLRARGEGRLLTFACVYTLERFFYEVSLRRWTGGRGGAGGLSARRASGLAFLGGWDAKRLRLAALTALQGPPTSGQNSQRQSARRSQALQLQDALILLSGRRGQIKKTPGSHFGTRNSSFITDDKQQRKVEASVSLQQTS